MPVPAEHGHQFDTCWQEQNTGARKQVESTEYVNLYPKNRQVKQRKNQYQQLMLQTMSY